MDKSAPDNDEMAWLHAPCRAVKKNLFWTLETRETHFQLWDLREEMWTRTKPGCGLRCGRRHVNG